MVTILILVDGFLQLKNHYLKLLNLLCHNPYFSRWFSAILLDLKKYKAKRTVTILILVDGFLQCNRRINKQESKCHNPYFSRWFSAILSGMLILLIFNRHNPYFSRWFSAIWVSLFSQQD